MTPPVTTALVLAAGLLMAGCGAAPTAPAAVSGAPASIDSNRAPDFSRVEVRYGDGLLHVVADVTNPGSVAPFGPRRAGGWCFQLFIDSDQRASGYGPGIDYLVRAIEVTPGGGVDVRRASGGGGPGGWGESVGRVSLDVRTGHMECVIPLEVLGPDDGVLNFVLETYRTLEKDGGGLYHEFVADYAGTSVSFGRAAGPITRGLEPLAPFANRLP